MAQAIEAAHGEFANERTTLEEKLRAAMLVCSEVSRLKNHVTTLKQSERQLLNQIEMITGENEELATVVEMLQGRQRGISVPEYFEQFGFDATHNQQTNSTRYTSADGDLNYVIKANERVYNDENKFVGVTTFRVAVDVMEHYFERKLSTVEVASHLSEHFGKERMLNTYSQSACTNMEFQLDKHEQVQQQELAQQQEEEEFDETPSRSISPDL